MRNAIIYIGLIGSSVYASYIAGNILANIDDSSSGQITEQIGSQSYSTGTSNHPFDFLIPQSHSYSIEVGQSNDQKPSLRTSTNDESKSSGGSTFKLFEEKEANHNSGGGGGAPMSTTTVKSSGRKQNRYNDEGGNGFSIGGLGNSFSIGGNNAGGGAILANNESNSANTRFGNSTGGFGDNSGFGDEEFNALAPIPDPTPIPLDSGSIVLIILGIITGGYFLLKNTRLNIFKEA